MPGQLTRDAKCWSCGEPIVAVYRTWKTDGRVECEFEHEAHGVANCIASLQPHQYEVWSKGNEVHPPTPITR